ncbi:vitamin K epoxide reductase family protein [Maribacter chungangensis]|uniref:Vitamin K epoxide reductase family protein n=1 Tax=Maribacter chungangensis TaxID=1069117 RepID=A0ABW3B4K0_9FLAO
MDNCVAVTDTLLGRLKVKHTHEFVADTVLSHGEHPSLLAIADTLEKYNTETLAVKIDFKKLSEIPLPCVVQLKERLQEIFVVLNAISNESVSYVADTGKPIQLLKEEFIKKWTGIALLTETTAETKEPGIEKRLTVKRTRRFLLAGIFACLGLWILLALRTIAVAGTTDLLLAASYTLLKGIGLVAGVLLLWFEVDEYNPTLQNFCSGGGKVNCNAVLSSAQAKLFNGTVSLSSIGFSYFFATLAILLLTDFSSSSLALSGYLSIATLPIILASVYYQAVVIKQWCKFCIVVQAVLVLEIVLTVLGGYYKAALVLESTSLLAVFFLAPLLLWSWAKPLIDTKKETNLYKRGLKKLKNNLNVFHGLLSKSRKITNTTEGLGIILTNKNAKYDVIKVCNPYCGPCADAHPVLEALVQKGIINLQILFTARIEDDHIANPVRHFLAIDTLGKPKETQKALDAWYNAQTKDYALFSKAFPLNGALAVQDEKITKMRAWCDVENITHTPTLFINGHELPNEYSVEDVKEVLV